MNDRILWIDVARGISILAMITFHFAFDLMYFGLAKSDLIYQPDWQRQHGQLWTGWHCG